MKNVQTGHWTEVTYEEVKYNLGLADGLFSERSLRNPRENWPGEIFVGVGCSGGAVAVPLLPRPLLFPCMDSLKELRGKAHGQPDPTQGSDPGEGRLQVELSQEGPADSRLFFKADLIGDGVEERGDADLRGSISIYLPCKSSTSAPGGRSSPGGRVT